LFKRSSWPTWYLATRCTSSSFVGLCTCTMTQLECDMS
jgi:hypothetical protein